jgi:hypothetical protein
MTDYQQGRKEAKAQIAQGKIRPRTWYRGAFRAGFIHEMNDYLRRVS